MKPVTPSTTLAVFMFNNTTIPYTIWLKILWEKYNLEYDDLIYKNEKFNNLNRHKLRSGRKYLSCYNNLYEKFIMDSNILFNSFTIKRSNSIHFDKMVYNSLVKYVNYIVSWIHYIAFNIKHSNSVKTLYQTIKMKNNEICRDVRKMRSNSQYNKWSNMVIDDILKIGKYMACPCQEYNRKPKCQCCHKFESYIYDYHNDHNNYMTLRSGTQIYKPSSVKKPIMFDKVYII